MNLEIDIDKALARHCLWKLRLAWAVRTGADGFGLETTGADDRCEFGRWLNALAPETRAAASCETVRRLHTQFHRQAALVLRLALHGHKEVAALAMARGSGFDRISADLIDAMRVWQASLGIRRRRA